MAKYARKVDGRWIDVYTVPSDFFSDLADLEKKLGVEGFETVDDGVQHGALDNGDGTYTNPAAPDVSTPPHTETVLAFKRRFTAQERIDIRASEDPVVIDFMDLVDSAQEINFSDPDLIAGLNYLEETAELLDEGRAAELLTP